MIVPGPARRHVDLEGDLAAQALAGGGLAKHDGFGFLLLEFLFWKHREILQLVDMEAVMHRIMAA